jgi:RHS repeat-associated protein
MEQLTATGRGNTTVGIVYFSDIYSGVDPGTGPVPEFGVDYIDMNPIAPGVQLYTTPLADTNNNGILDIREVLNFDGQGGTNFTLPLLKARDWFSSVPGNGNLVFLSDGHGALDEQIVAELRAANVNINAVGIGVDAGMEQLRKIDPKAVQVTKPSDAINIFSGWDNRFSPEPLMENVKVYLDLNNNGQLDANESSQSTHLDTTDSLFKEKVVYQFVFDNLLPGTYTLRQVVPNGYQPTAPVTNGFTDTITINGGEIFTHLFGNHKIANLPNQNPVFTSTLSTQRLAIGETLTYQVTASDPNADPLTYDLPVAPAGMVIDPKTGILVWQPKGDQAGTANFLVRVSDSRGGFDLQYLTLDVTPPNTPPAFTSVFSANTSPQVGKPFEYQAIAIDADGDPVTYRLINSVPGGIAINATTGLLSWTPTAEQLGQQAIAIQARDGRGGETLQTLNLSVIAARPNTAPDITSSPRLVTRVDTPYLYRIAVTDPDSDPLRFSLVEAPQGMTIDTQGQIGWRPTATQIGTHTVTISVNDGQGGSDTQSYRLSVRHLAENYTPTIISQPALLTNLGRSYQYQATATDPNGDALFWELAQAPEGMVIDARTGGISWQPIANQVGDHTVSVSATDTLGAFATQTFTLQVRGTNTPPQIFSTPPTQVGINQPYTYAVQARDPENDSLSFSLAGRPEGMAIDARTGQIQWTPTATQLGSHTVEMLVSDPQGGIGRQLYTLLVAPSAVNQAPTITSTPKFWADTVSGYRYQLAATDPEGDNLTYSLLAGPAGITVDGTTGLLQWQPTVAQLGQQTITVAAFDRQGLGATQQYTLTVTERNQAPVIRSTPTLTTLADTPYRYDVWASDPDGEPITIALTQAPKGMAIDGLGRVSWTPGTAAIGTYPIGIQVIDSRGAVTTQLYDLVVQADTIAPRVSLSVSDPQVNIGSSVTLRVSATDNIGVDKLRLSLNGTPVTFDAQGLATLKLNTAGVSSILATATDVAGNTGTAKAQVLVIDPTDRNAPVVDLTSFADGKPLDSLITAPTGIVGTVTDSNLLYYTLSLAPVAGGKFTEIYRGTNTVNQNLLGTFNPTVLQNDSYILRLSATDAGGLTAYDETLVNVAGDLKLGNFRLSFTDLSIPVAGIPIQVTRTYDTLTANTTDDFGYGWRMEFRDTDLRTSLGRDAELDELGVPSKGFAAGDRVYITLPGGKREAFTFSPQARGISRYFPPFEGGDPTLYNPTFVADSGITDTLSVENVTLIRSETGEFVALNGGKYNPAADLYGFGGYYKLTTKEGIVYRINATTGDLETVSDRNGNTLTFTDAAITSSTGQKVTFERNTQGQITSVIDPAGKRVTYTYDTLGDLVAVTDRENNTTQFDYNDNRAHYLEKVIDPLNRSAVRTEYDDQGRLKRMIDADGYPVELTYKPGESIQEVTDQFGNKTIYRYDDRGNVLTEINAEGEVTERTYDANNWMRTETKILEDGTRLTTTSTYDADGDILTETDPLGNVTRYTYDSYGNVLTTTDPTGLTVTNTYDTRGNLKEIKGQASGTMNFGYDAFGNLKEMQDGAGKTTFDYDSSGNLISQTDASGKVNTYTYDANGNRKTETTTQTLANGTQRTLVTLMEYDNAGHVIKVTDPEGGVSETRYDKVGNRIWEKNARGYITEYRYDDRGELIETIYPDETPATSADNPRTINLYDIGGRLRATIDEEGFATHFVYDKAGRQIATIYPDSNDTLTQLIAAIAPGQTPATIDWTQVVYSNETPAYLSTNPRTRTEYDDAGRVKAQIDERGNRTESRYDNAGHLIETILPDETPATLTDNPRITSTYDNAGRQLTQTDALGHTTRLLYDLLGRSEGQEYVDGSRTRVEYDAAGRVKTRIDQEGKATQYEYDVLGRLKAVIDARNQRTEYTYDNQGNLISQKDANNHVTRYEYDGLGRRIATVLPLGQRSTNTYDAVGDLKTTTDFNGDLITYNYDARNRLIFKDLPGTQFDVSYTYTLDGQRKTVTDSRGITTYAYDARNHLLERVDPDGRKIGYTYDLAGNRTSVIIPSGMTTYTFDAQNRLSTVRDPQGGVTAYTYDLAGNLIRTTLPNNTVETRQYNDLNRLYYLENSGPNGIINSFRYTLDKTGTRRAVEEHDGRQVQYSYDELYRLTQEAITNPGATNLTRTIGYRYDSVGNRLSRNDSAEGVTTYAYDANDRLLNATTSGIATTYTYDNNGNTTGKTTGGNTVTYQWNAENRLISADTNGDGTIDVLNRYNEDGIRVSQTVNGQETKFLIDANLPYAQVLEEYTSGGSVNVSYVYGNDLISQNRNGERAFYHVDGLGSTRALTDEFGFLNNRYVYDAFGQTITFIGNTSNSYLFAGEQQDLNLNFNYLRTRYLDSSNGRFVIRDTFPGFQQSPLSGNKYLYGDANPVNNIDPSGLFSIQTVVATTLMAQSISAIGYLYYGWSGIVGGGKDVSWDATLISFDAASPVKAAFKNIKGFGTTTGYGFSGYILKATSEPVLVGRGGTAKRFEGIWLMPSLDIGYSAGLFTETSGEGTLKTSPVYLKNEEIAKKVFSGPFSLFDYSFASQSITKGFIGSGYADFSGAFSGFHPIGVTNSVGYSFNISWDYMESDSNTNRV